MRLQLAGTSPSRLPCPVARIEERTSSPVHGSVAMIVASRSAIRGIPIASIAPIAHTAGPPASCTRCPLGTPENGYAQRHTVAAHAHQIGRGQLPDRAARIQTERAGLLLHPAAVWRLAVREEVPQQGLMQAAQHSRQHGLLSAGAGSAPAPEHQSDSGQ